ncbi:MAG: Rrf2 family transcriptional regulator [Candidatus Ornithospirochaeta sp.]|nr:Rrf2 family transcriptional regulator [Candidatus Ornithospirochaeta sp.]
MDTRFSVAVHMLILISESPEPISSDQMAESVGTNASYIRKILSLLRKAGIVEARRGISGSRLAVAPDRLTLLQIYLAVVEEGIHLIDIHRNSNDMCIVGKHIGPMLTDMLDGVTRAFAEALGDRKLSDCIEGIRKRIR